MTAATNPDVGRLTWGYTLGALSFALLIVVALSYFAWRAHGGSVEAFLDRQIAKKRQRARAALARGDAQILRAVEEAEAAHARRHTRPSIPRQLERNARR